MPLNCLTQKVELNYLIPAIRIRLINLLEKEGLSDAEIARRLNITKAAVSQYKHKKRGKKINFPLRIENEIKNASIAIMKGKSANTQIFNIINETKKSRCICTICRECK